MIIKQQNETAKYEARLEKLNKTIKNKNELLQKKRIERISTNLEAKNSRRGKKIAFKGKQACTPEEPTVKGKTFCTPEESTIKGKQVCTPKKSIVKGKQVCTPKESTVKGKQVCTPKESTVKGKNVSTTKESKVEVKRAITPNLFVSAKLGDVTMERLL